MILQGILIILIYIALAVLVAYIGRRRKWGFWGYLWSSILCTPLMGLLFVLAADAPKHQQEASPYGRENRQ